MPVYATPDDLAAWVDPVPADAVSRLRAAAAQVLYATRAAVYEVDVDGLPTSVELKTAMRDATCAQVALWAQLGITPGAAPSQAGRVVSKSQGGRSVSFAQDDPGTVAQRAAIAVSVTPATEPYLILANAGLLNGKPSW